MRILFACLLAALLTACGGGSAVINCTAASACTFTANGNTVTGTLPSIPGSSASAPATGASSPSTTLPASSVPLAAVHNLPPNVTITAGDLRWDAGGVTYMVGIASNGDATWIGVWSLPAANANGEVGQSVASLEVMLDSSFDLHTPAADDASLKAYMAATIQPKLDAWMQDQSSRWANGMTVQAVNTKDIPPLASNAADRLAGRLPQWLDITPFGAALK